MKYGIHVEESIDISAPPEIVYATILDVTRWGRFSPECTGATTVTSAGPLTVGSKFSGHNRKGARRWTTHCTVTVADDNRFFSFNSAAVGLQIATWSYKLEPHGGGTRLTEIWHDNRGRTMRMIAIIVSGIRDRATHNRESMKTTLANLKAHLENPPPVELSSTPQHVSRGPFPK